MAAALREGFAGNLWLDYNRLYDHLLTGFAPEEIRFVSFDAMRAHAGGPVACFLEGLGLGIAPSALAPLADSAAHVSPRPLEFLAAHALTAPHFPSGPELELARQVLRSHLGDSAPDTLFTAEELAGLQARFAPLNARLQSRLRATAPDFVMPRWPGWQDRHGRDVLDQEFWIALARSAFCMPAPTTAPRG